MRYHLTLKSANAKTGPIPVSTTSSDSCPLTCGQRDACYAKGGPLAIHWKALDAGKRGTDLSDFCDSISQLPDATLWRHNQAGDLPGVDGKIDRKALQQIVTANKGKRGFTYTHKPMNKANAAIVRDANAKGFTVNVSADTLAQVDRAKSLNCGPVVVVLPHDAKESITTPAGHKVIVCPATVRDDVTCQTCKLCAWSQRDVVIGFPAHGSRAKLVKLA